MSRCLPVSKIKTTKRGKHFGASLSDMPSEGTKLRSLYDHFQSHKGEVCAFVQTCSSRRLSDLRDYYGMDIRFVGYGRYLLAGEWFGRVYIDYVAERIEAAQ